MAKGAGGPPIPKFTMPEVHVCPTLPEGAVMMVNPLPPMGHARLQVVSVDLAKGKDSVVDARWVSINGKWVLEEIIESRDEE